MIQTTSQCNRKCPFCYYGIKRSIPSATMEDDIFKKIIYQLSSIRFTGRVSLFEINEPFTDEKILERIDYAVEKLPLAFHHLMTNGDLITEEKLIYVADRVDRLDFNSYDQNALERNKRYIDIIKEKSVKAAIKHRNHVNRKSYLSRAGHIKKYILTDNIIGRFCELSHQVLMISPNGDVLGCWHDFHHVNTFGNIKDRSIMDIWFSKEFKMFRHRLSLGNREFSPLCRQCDYPGYGGFTYCKIHREKYTVKFLDRLLNFRYPKIQRHKWLFKQMMKRDNNLREE